MLQGDDSAEFLSRAFVACSKSAGMMIQHIQPGDLNQNAYIERFNRTYRTEVRKMTYWWMID